MILTCWIEKAVVRGQSAQISRRLIDDSETLEIWRLKVKGNLLFRKL
jgi:hypothetical protein